MSFRSPKQLAAVKKNNENHDKLTWNFKRKKVNLVLESHNRSILSDRSTSSTDCRDSYRLSYQIDLLEVETVDPSHQTDLLEVESVDPSHQTDLLEVESVDPSHQTDLLCVESVELRE